MIKYEDNLAARINGNNLQPLAGALVTVTDKVTNLPASLYQDDELTPIAQPLTTDNNGYFAFRAADGRYTLTFAAGPNSSRFDTFTRDAVLEDPADNPFMSKQELALASGATKIGYGSGRTVADKLGDVVSVKDAPFNAKGDGVTDDTAALQAARDWLAANQDATLIFPTGTYKYSASPNWAIQNATIQAEGAVRLRYTGTGNAVIFAVDNPGVAGVFNVRFLGNFIVEAPSTAGHGFLVRAVHHSTIEGRVAGCGTASNALQVEFAVCTEFNIRASVNQSAWHGGGKPNIGINLTRRNASENTSACIFRNPIIEGVNSHGIVFDYAIQNTVIVGTSEHNTGVGVVCTANSQDNSFLGLDLEFNDGGGIKDGGRNNMFNGVLNSDSTTIDATAELSTYRGGYYDSFVNNGKGTVLDGVRYSTAGGTITQSGGSLVKRSVFSATSGTFDPDQQQGSVTPTPVSVPHSTATTVLTLPSVGNNVFHVIAAIEGTGRADLYTSYALIAQDGANWRILSQTNGTNVTLTLSGGNVQVSQTSGATQPVRATAKPI